jgi:YVTN family beta-propeller protein
MKYQSKKPALFPLAAATIMLLLLISTFSGGMLNLAKADSIIATIMSPAIEPSDMVFDPANGKLYELDISAFLSPNHITIIDGSTNKVSGDIPNIPHPNGIAFDSANRNLYVTDFGRVFVISGQTNKVIGTIPISGAHSGIAFDSANGNLYVANSGSNTVSVISGTTNTIVGSPIPVGNNPLAVAFDLANGNLYVANERSVTVSIISGQTNQVIQTLLLDPELGFPQAIAYDSINHNVYVGAANPGTVFVISTSPVLPPTISYAVVQTSILDATLHTNGVIQTDGSGGAFGYGIVTSAGFSAVIVATTHEGVRDSITQGTGAGPIWHNHFVRLAVIPTGPCGSSPQVTAITFQQPGQVFISDTNAVLLGIPSSFRGTDALTGQPLTLTPGHNVQNVVSFVLAPIFSGSTLRAVCVEHIIPAQHILKS